MTSLAFTCGVCSVTQFCARRSNGSTLLMLPPSALRSYGSTPRPQTCDLTAGVAVQPAVKQRAQGPAEREAKLSLGTHWSAATAPTLQNRQALRYRSIPTPKAASAARCRSRSPATSAVRAAHHFELTASIASARPEAM